MIKDIESTLKNDLKKEGNFTPESDKVFLLENFEGLYLQRNGGLSLKTSQAIYFDEEEDAQRYANIKEMQGLRIKALNRKSLELEEKAYRVIEKDYYNILTGISKIISRNMEKEKALEISRFLNENNNLKYFAYTIIDEFTLPYDGVSEYLKKDTYNLKINQNKAYSNSMNFINLPSFMKGKNAEEIPYII